jgi:hypothetical protein
VAGRGGPPPDRSDGRYAGPDDHLPLDERRLALRDRKARADAIRKTAAELDKAGALTPALRVKYALMAGEIAVGHALPAPEIPDDPMDDFVGFYTEVNHWSLGTAGRDLFDAYLDVAKGRGPLLGRSRFYEELRRRGWRMSPDTSHRVWLVRPVQLRTEHVPA